MSRDEFLEAFDSGLLGTGLRIMLGQYRFLLPKKAYLKTCQRVHSWLEYYIRRQVDSTSNGTQVPSQQRRSMAKNLGGQTEDLEYIRGQILQSMLASKETTAVLVSNAMFLLSRHPDVYNKLRKEVLQYPEGEDLFTFDNLSNLTYLQNVIKEALRLYPVFPLNGRIALRDTTLPASPDPTNPQLTKLQPAPVPAGSTVVMSWYSLHRSESIFGDDAASFNPDRWNTIKPTQYEYMPFGGGQRACLGREKSLAEGALVLARLAERFQRVESRDSRDWKPKTGISYCNANGCKIALYR
ncbi:cytochrome P450 [Polyplosphaeria fusca]|uniref:Cytochrome P450 n=1 Tax=Polyplosphaeria fusca TaxID=682080 RepID=A0A9P4UZM9_9PLEO|nr:cytochrome P450 [Polyplosphaeria fusca]